MLRYFVLATVIVVGSAMAIAGWINRDALRIKIASVYAPVPPKPETATTTGRGAAVGLYGDAPWALSALPECLIQTSETTGSRSYVLAHLPAGAVALPAPATLKFGDCTISLAGDEAYVRRATDRFRIPPRVRFFRAPGALALFREDASGGNELRVYQPVSEHSKQRQ